ncbi:MAG: hypothetical protein JF628_06695 [Sphingomonas sp.]|jgi:hypothetical protein|nr:hypothetical protein [Sphingomonas sp.]MBW8844145.1 hypothetical protein [Burkholderiales bacterium]
MAKKKDFGVGGPPPKPVIPIFPTSRTLERAAVSALVIPLPHGVDAEFDWWEYLGHGFDDTVSAITLEMRAMVARGRPKPLALKTIANGGVIHWFRFCVERASAGTPPTLDSINAETIEVFAGWLATRLKPDGELWSLNTARTVYQKVKTVLEALADRKLLPRDGLFPKNPFPGATDINRRRNHILPLSDGERERILRPLAMQVAQVYDGTHPGTPSTQLGLCVFAIFLKTGVNPTPFLEIPRDLQKCFMSHPRVNTRILVTFKRRANKRTKTPLEPESRVVSLDVYKLCERVLGLTEGAAKLAVGTKLEGLLWVYELDGAPRGMTTETLSAVANAFTSRHALVRDDGTRLKMSSQLFRNTKLNRVWRASKGDLLATARSGSNTPTAAQRYLAVTPDMLDEHRMAGEVLVDTLSAAGPRDNTPHSGCKDAFNGEFAPKDGSPCVDFLSCFRCKSQVIIQDDLYKLFSFYWALFSQRSHIGQDNWRKLFGWVTRVIDRDIAPKFDATVVERERARARSEPHPMWRSPSVLAALRSIQ